MRHYRRPAENGITLTELLVSSVLIGIVMLGVTSFSVSIRNLQGSTNRAAIVTMRTKAAMARLANDAMRAVGDESDRGVYSWTNNNNRSSICFRHDDFETPEDYSDDTWVCYWHDNTFMVERCVDPNAAPFSGPCNNENRCCRGANPRNNSFLQLADTASEFAAVVDNAGVFQDINLTLTNRFIWNDPAHPITNPEHTITTRISPIGHSR